MHEQVNQHMDGKAWAKRRRDSNLICLFFKNRHAKAIVKKQEDLLNE